MVCGCPLPHPHPFSPRVVTAWVGHVACGASGAHWEAYGRGPFPPHRPLTARQIRHRSHFAGIIVGLDPEQLSPPPPPGPASHFSPQMWW